MLLIIFMSLRSFRCSRSLREVAEAVFPVREAFVRSPERYFAFANPSRDRRNVFSRPRRHRETALTIFHAREAFASTTGGGRPLSFGLDMFISLSRFIYRSNRSTRWIQLLRIYLVKRFFTVNLYLTETFCQHPHLANPNHFHVGNHILLLHILEHIIVIISTSLT